MAGQQRPLTGQRVRILVCPQNHPDHVGQVGTVAQTREKVATTRVYVGTGICQAAAVELVDGPVTEVERTSAQVFSNLLPPEFRRQRR
jgi:hypothetical protein